MKTLKLGLFIAAFLSAPPALAKCKRTCEGKLVVAYKLKNKSKKHTVTLAKLSAQGTYGGGCHAIPKKGEKDCVIMNNQGLKKAKCRACKKAQQALNAAWKSKDLAQEVCKKAKIGNKAFRLENALINAKKDSIQARPLSMVVDQGWRTCGSCPKGYKAGELGCVKYVDPTCPSGFKLTATKDQCYKLAP